MEKIDKNTMIMLSLSGYDQVTSINNLIVVGRNIERVDYNRYLEDLDRGNISDIDALDQFVEEYYEVVKDTNDISDLSIELITEQVRYMNHFSDMFADIVLGSTGDDPILSKQIDDVEKFKKYISICQGIMNANSFLIFNPRDLFTVSTLTMMEIIDTLEIKNENIRFDLLKIIGRRNESKHSDVDPWLETIEYDYELFHIKRVLDAVLDIIAISPKLLTHLIIYKSILTAEFIDKFNLLNPETEIDDVLLNNMAIDIMEIIESSLESVVDIMNRKKYSIAPYYVEIFDEELSKLSFVKIDSIMKRIDTPETESPLSDFDDSTLIKIYKLSIHEEDFKDYIEVKLEEYLELAGYFDTK